MSENIISFYRARLAREKGVIRKDWGGRLSIALTYPNYYRVGMSNLGFQVIYQLLNAHGHVAAERVFLPDDHEIPLYRETGKGLLSMETQSMLHTFDVIAFSLSFENDYPNILKILELGKIPLQVQDRDEHHPLIMGGGIAAFINPEPLSIFFDLFFLGEAETELDTLIRLLTHARNARASKPETLETLVRGMKSIYVPSLYRVEYKEDGTIRSRNPLDNAFPETIPVSRSYSPAFPVHRSTIMGPDTAFGNKVLIELGRGCGRSCRFCAAGYVYRPPRMHTESELLSAIQQGSENFFDMGLLSASVLDTPGIVNIARQIVEMGGQFSVSSLRADLLTPDILDLLKQAGQKTLAIAPEAGSERLRRVINKHLTFDQIIRAVRMIARVGAFGLRLYFLIGLPTETKEDVSEILELVKKIKHHMVKESKARGRIGRIHLSVNCFIPKPFTPFQWFPMEDVATLKEKQKWLKKACTKEGGVDITFDVPKWAYVQSLLSLGDRRVGAMILSAHQNEGDWTKTFRSSDLNPDFFVYRPKGLDETLPWDFMDHGIHKEFLIKEYKLALKEQESDICQAGECERCGVCKGS